MLPFSHPLIVLLGRQVHCEDEVEVVVGDVAALGGQNLREGKTSVVAVHGVGDSGRGCC